MGILILTSALPCEAKKLHRFIFAIALSELNLFRHFLAHVYFNKFPIMHVCHILHIIRGGKPAYVSKVGLQRSSSPCTHSHRAALLQDAGLQL